MQFIVPKRVCILLKPDFRAFYAVSVILVSLLRVFHKLLEPDRRFKLKADSDVSDGFIGLRYTGASRLTYMLAHT